MGSATDCIQQEHNGSLHYPLATSRELVKAFHDYSEGGGKETLPFPPDSILAPLLSSAPLKGGGLIFLWCLL